MKNFRNILICLLFSSIALAENYEVVDVKRNIPLAEDEPVYKDFYIKTNGKSDLKKNLVIKAVRKISVKDSSMKPIGDFTTVVGLLKIIQVSDTIAVAREFKLIPRGDEPMIDQVGIMVGDEIDLRESFTDTSKPIEKLKEKKTASAQSTIDSTVNSNLDKKKEEVPVEKAAAVPAKEDI